MAENQDWRVRDPKGVIPRREIRLFAIEKGVSVAEALAELVRRGLKAGK